MFCFYKKSDDKKRIPYIFDILCADEKELISNLKISVNNFNDIIEECKFSLMKNKMNESNNIIIMPLKAINSNMCIMLTELKTQAIYEIVGLPSSGKTEFAIRASML